MSLNLSAFIRCLSLISRSLQEEPDTLRSARVDAPFLSIDKSITTVTKHARIGDLCLQRRCFRSQNHGYFTFRQWELPFPARDYWLCCILCMYNASNLTDSGSSRPTIEHRVKLVGLGYIIFFECHLGSLNQVKV